MWKPRLLGAPVDPHPVVIDSGARKVLDVRFLSLDQTADEQISVCDGDEFVLTFEVMSDDWFGDPLPIGCTLSGFASNPDRCRPFDWELACLTVPEDATGCGPDPNLSPVPARPQVDTEGTYCFPLWRSVQSCLASAIPTSGDVAMIVRVDAGTTDVRNLAIDVWTAIEGWPSPASCEGERLYRRVAPVANMQVGWLAAGATLVIDGTSGTIEQSCFGRGAQNAAGAVTSWQGAFQHPRLAAGCRQWVTVTADCMFMSDALTVSVEFVPRFRG
jgi:hypothetical protein